MTRYQSGSGDASFGGHIHHCGPRCNIGWTAFCTDPRDPHWMNTNDSGNISPPVHQRFHAIRQEPSIE